MVNIRNMEMTDLGTIVEMENDIFPDPWSSKAFSDIIFEPNWRSLVVETNGVIVGYACYLIIDIEVHLANIAVTELYRRKSVAKKLVEHILRVVSDLKCEYILLEVRLGNAQAIAFYEKHGFRLMCRCPDYYHNPVEDALVMVYYLRSDEEGE